MLGVNLDPKNLSVGNHRIHYAWAMVVLAAFMRLSTSSFRSSQSILIPRLVESFGWSYGAVGGAFALQWVVSGAFGPPAGWLGDRYGVRVTMTVGALLFILGMVLTSTVSHLWQFYLYFGLILSASMGIFQVPLTAAVTLWFKKRLGWGMGLLQSSQGMGPVIAVPIILIIVHNMGLRAAFWLPGLAGGIFILFLIRFFYNEPADLGMRPLGADESEPIRSTQRGDVAALRSKVFLRQARRTSAFWNLIGIHYWGCAGHAIILVYLVAMAESKGVAPGAAAVTFVVLSVFSTLPRFAVPVIADYMGSKGVMAFCFFLQTAPIFLLFFANDAWMFYLFAALFGIGFGGEMTAFPIINRQYYGSAPIGTTYGWQMMGAGFGMASGAAIGGLLRDITGDFNLTMALSLALSTVGVISILRLPSTSQPLLPDWEDELLSDKLAASLAGETHSD